MKRISSIFVIFLLSFIVLCYLLPGCEGFERVNPLDPKGHPMLSVSKGELSLDGSYGSSDTLIVRANIAWSVVDVPDWLIVSPLSSPEDPLVAGKPVIVSITPTGPNASTDHRSAVIKFIGPGVNALSVSVVQGSVGGVMSGNDGKTYKTIIIGDQVWMMENLKETQYRNGDVIPIVTDNTIWAGLTSGARCVYDNDESNADTYGYLYNWYAAADARNIAPAGWRVPSDDDWTALTDYLIANGYNWDGLLTGNEIGKAMASSGGEWIMHGTQGNVGNDQSSNNTSGFSALPAGYRYYDGYFSHYGYFYDLGYYAYFWSATELSADTAWYRYLYFYGSGASRYYGSKQGGFSLRLLRD